MNSISALLEKEIHPMKDKLDELQIVIDSLRDKISDMKIVISSMEERISNLESQL